MSMNENIITTETVNDLNKFFQDNRLFVQDLYTDGTHIYCDIDWGDWKHEHLRSNYLVTEFFKKLGYEVINHDSIVTDDNGSDTYSATHRWTVIKKDESLKENYGYEFTKISQLDDIISGMAGNMSDEDMDKDLKLFSRIAKELGVENYADVYVLTVDDSEYDLSWYDDDKLKYIKDLYKLRNNVKLYEYNGKKYVFEHHPNGRYFIYAKTENDLDDIMYYIESQYDFDELHEDLSQKDIDFNDKYFPRVDISNTSKYDYYKHNNKDYVYDKSKNLVIMLFKDEDEVKELGDSAPYRELDTVGLSQENWSNKELRDEYLDEYEFNLQEESDALLNDFIKYEL